MGAALALGALLVVLAAIGARQWWASRTVRSEAKAPPPPLHPYQCVAIAARGHGCELARSLVGHRFLAAEAPRLPLAGCSRVRCACVYLHFEDRRHHTRRAAEAAQTGIRSPSERRNSPGRRRSDRAYAH